MRWRLALAELRQHPSRVIAVVLAIMISVGFIVAAMTFISTQQAILGAAATAPESRSDAVVRPTGDDRKPAALLAAIGAESGVHEVEPHYQGPSDFQTAKGPGLLQLESLSIDPSLRWAGLTAGRWPDTISEVAISPATARQTGLKIGDTFATTDSYTTTGELNRQHLSVVGISDVRPSLLSGSAAVAFVTPAYFQSAGTVYEPTDYLIRADPGTDSAALVDRLRERLGAGVDVDTPAALAAQTLRKLTRGADVFRAILLIFGAIALLVGSIIIVNTFTILLVQRRRQIGLLRAVGASGRQVRQSVLLEALVVGVVGSVLGIGLGLALAALGSVITGSIGAGLMVPWIAVGESTLGGVLITMLAASIPARRASRIPPLDALRPVGDLTRAKRNSRVRLSIAIAALLIGSGLLAIGLIQGTEPLLLAVAGSFLIAVGVLALTPNLLPAALSGLGRPASRIGPVSRLAVGNSVRNPGRVAATCTALMLTVGLIVTLQVGAASTKATVIDELNTRFPVDLTVRDSAGSVPGSVRQNITAIPGVASVVPVATTEVTMAGHRANGPLTLLGPGPAASVAARGGFGAVRNGDVLLTRFTLKEFGLQVGQQLTLRHGTRSSTLTVRLSDLPDDASLLTSRAELIRLDRSARNGELWASVPDVEDAGDVLARVRQLTGTSTSVSIAGSLGQTADYVTLLDTLLTIATALLAVAVLIALIGVGNTLGLSVLERTRESALLRALGLQRRQLRAMLVIEAILLALVGAVVGIVVGVVFGWLGTVALSKQFAIGAPQFAMSPVQTGAVVLLAVVAGAVASVLPARRAARATPTEALADV